MLEARTHMHQRDPPLRCNQTDGEPRGPYARRAEIHPDYYQIPVADREKLLAERRTQIRQIRRITRHHADIAVAVAIEGGLITPIIRAAETKGLAQIASEMKDLAQRARDRKLRPEEFQGGTFSISNLGMFGIRSFASIINEPQGAILSVGAGEPRAIVRDGVLGVATMMSVTLTCDHRVVDGAIGARWLAAFKALIESPLIMVT